MRIFEAMILVTGATGFVGSHLVLSLLEKGENVRALYRNAAKINSVLHLFEYHKKEALFSKIEWFDADITDIPHLEKAFTGIDYVYHCAALISFDPNQEETLRKTNIEGTANVANLCLAYGVKKLCFVSSIAALGDLQEHETTITEETEWNPEKFHSDYAISKYGAEMEVFRTQQEGLSTVIVSPGIIIGNGDKNSGSGQLFTKVMHGQKYYTKGISGFVAVEDVVNAMQLLLKSDVQGEKFILIAENSSFDSILKEIALATHSKAPSIYAKKSWTEILYRLDWLVSTVFFTKRRLSKAMAKALHSTDLYSNSKVKIALDFEFHPIVKSIKKTAFYFTKNN